MQEMAERSVGGKVDLDYAPSGVTGRLTCPAAKALEPTADKERLSRRRPATDGVASSQARGQK
jgi:hypothetical protein